MRRRKPLPSWVEIANFYAGRPVTVAFGDLGGKLGTTGLPESGEVHLSPQVKRSLEDFVKYFRAGDHQRGSVLGALGIATLLHESVHNRHFDPATGFHGAGDERQANALGSELVADMLQRFFGLKINSKQSRLYQKAAKGLSSYQGAYYQP